MHLQIPPNWQFDWWLAFGANPTQWATPSLPSCPHPLSAFMPSSPQHLPALSPYSPMLQWGLLALFLPEARSWFGEVGTHWKSPLVPGHCLAGGAASANKPTPRPPLQNSPLLKTQLLLSCWKQQISTDTIHIKLTIKLQFNIPRQQWLLTASKACNPI